MELEDAAKTLADRCCGVSVYGDAVEPWQVKQIAREWLKLTEGDRWRTPPASRRTLWQRLFGRSHSEAERQ